MLQQALPEPGNIVRFQVEPEAAAGDAFRGPVPLRRPDAEWIEKPGNQIVAHRKVLEAMLLLEIFNNGALTCAYRSCNADNYHNVFFDCAKVQKLDFRNSEIKKTLDFRH